MAKTVDYYFSLVSPWSYMGLQRFLTIAERAGASINFKPMDLPRLFSETGGLPLPKRHPSRQAYRLQELERWRKRLGRDLILQPEHFPTNDTLGKCVLIVLQKQNADKLTAVMEDLHRALWVEDRQIADESVIAEVLSRHGLDAGAVLQAAKAPEVQEEIEKNTTEAIERGVFGVPSYVVGKEIFWGQDRLDFLEEALSRD